MTSPILPCSQKRTPPCASLVLRLEVPLPSRSVQQPARRNLELRIDGYAYAGGSDAHDDHVPGFAVGFDAAPHVGSIMRVFTEWADLRRDPHHWIPATLIIAAPIRQRSADLRSARTRIPSLNFLLSLIGRIAWATRGPKSRAGFHCVSSRAAKTQGDCHTRTPHNHGRILPEDRWMKRLCLPKLKPTTISKWWRLLRQKLAGRLRIAGDVQKSPASAADRRHSPVRQVGHPYQAGARECARTCPVQKMPTFDQFPEEVPWSM